MTNATNTATTGSSTQEEFFKALCKFSNSLNVGVSELLHSVNVSTFNEEDHAVVKETVEIANKIATLQNKLNVLANKTNVTNSPSIHMLKDLPQTPVKRLINDYSTLLDLLHVPSTKGLEGYKVEAAFPSAIVRTLTLIAHLSVKKDAPPALKELLDTLLAFNQIKIYLTDKTSISNALSETAACAQLNKKETFKSVIVGILNIITELKVPKRLKVNATMFAAKLSLEIYERHTGSVKQFEGLRILDNEANPHIADLLIAILSYDKRTEKETELTAFVNELPELFIEYSNRSVLIKNCCLDVLACSPTRLIVSSKTDRMEETLELARELVESPRFGINDTCFLSAILHDFSNRVKES